MTSTLVLGGARNDVRRHAATLLRSHEQITHIVCSCESSQSGPGSAEPGETAEAVADHFAVTWPESWATVTTRDLTRALLQSRRPVLVDDIGGWLVEQVAANDLRAPGAAVNHIDALLDELSVALRALPFDVVIITQESVPAPHCAQGADEALLSALLERVNRRLSAACRQVHLLAAGRVLDLSAAHPVGR